MDRLTQQAWDLLNLKPPKAPERVWLLIDISNGFHGGKNYCWFFTSQNSAKRFLREHKADSQRLEKERGYGLSTLVGPFLYTRGEK